MSHQAPVKQPKYLPISAEDAGKLGIVHPDVILVSADAYVDHPSFAAAVLGRVLVDAGFTVAVINQPDWRDRSGASFMEFGAPNLFFAVVPGEVDSMINAYTPALRRRRDDVYSPGGKLTRPERTTIVYTNILHRIYPKTPIVIGGVEASLRRFAHYDYWSDSVRQGILADTPASVLIYGMGEKPIVEIAQRVRQGKSLRGIRGTCHTVSVAEFKAGEVSGTVLPSYAEVKGPENRKKFAEFWKIFSESSGTLIQPHPKTVIVQNPEAVPLTTEELDRIYELPYTRKQHPAIKEPVPALLPIQFSIVTHRGCFGACSFCSITHHQGKRIISRSEASIIREAERMVKMPEFKGTISDVGGPSANMYGCSCKKQETKEPCRNKSCIGCPSLQSGMKRQLTLLRALRNLPKVKHVFISSGIRYDMIPETPEGDEYLRTVCAHHISGHLKVAPEHIVPGVTKLMNKPDISAFDAFRKRFELLQQGKAESGGKRQYLVPYLMSSHPGCRISDMVTLALYLREHNMYTEQVQDFTPSPMTLSTAMYYTGLDPRSGSRVYVPLGNEKIIQRAILQWRDPKQYDFVVSGLLKAGRRDLIGDLVPDRGIPDRSITHQKRRR